MVYFEKFKDFSKKNYKSFTKTYFFLEIFLKKT